MTTVFLFFKQKTAYELRISDWSSDVCSSDLCGRLWKSGGESVLNFSCGPWPGFRPLRVCAPIPGAGAASEDLADAAAQRTATEIGRASCRERVCQYV